MNALLFQVAFCIHNIAYQGRFAFEDFSLLNLPDSFKSSFDFMDGYTNQQEAIVIFGAKIPIGPHKLLILVLFL